MSWRRFLEKTQDYLRRVQDPTPQASRLLCNFKNEADLANWRVFTDNHWGGKSSAALSPSQVHPGTAEFSGVCSRELGDDPAVKRSGFCSVSYRPPHDEVMDLGEFDALSFRVFGDGVRYIANIRTENWLVGEQSMDVWQAFLIARKGIWQEITIPLDEFALTWKGRVVESEMELNTERVVSVGIAVAAADGGAELRTPYKLGLDWIVARNLSMGFHTGF